VLDIGLSTQVYRRKEMIIVEKKEEIRRAYYIQGKSIRQINRETGHHRRTIRKALEDGMKPEYKRRESHSRPVMGPVKTIIDQWLEKDKTQPPKQRHTAKRIYERLKEEYGFGGAESTVRYYVAQRRREMGNGNDVFIPLGYAPGQMAQVDFGEAEVIISGKRLTAQIFCLRLCYSKQAFVMALPTQSQEAFFEGHVRAFDFLGGVPRHLVYDNLKAAVNKVLKGRDREEQVAFIAFRSHYLFESRFCNPAQAHEKGLVEGLVGYSRRNFLVPIPEEATWDDLNSYLWEKCKAEGPRRLRNKLLPLPSRQFPCCALHPVGANGFGMVTFQTNRYSVPAHYAHEAIWLRAFSDRVEITNGRKTLAVHTRCYDREQDILNPLHYLPLLERRPGAWENAKPIQEWRQSWPEVYDRYLVALRDQLAVSQATREFVRILRLHESYSGAIITKALEKALECHCYNVDGVKQLVMGLKESLESARIATSIGEVPTGDIAAEAYASLAVEPVVWPEVGQFGRLLHSATSGSSQRNTEGSES
jgi:transposase